MVLLSDEILIIKEIIFMEKEVKKYICSECSIKMLIFKKYCKIFYGNKFLMKSEKEVEKRLLFVRVKSNLG